MKKTIFFLLIITIIISGCTERTLEEIKTSEDELYDNIVDLVDDSFLQGKFNGYVSACFDMVDQYNLTESPSGEVNFTVYNPDVWCIEKANEYIDNIKRNDPRYNK